MMVGSSTGFNVSKMNSLKPAIKELFAFHIMRSKIATPDFCIWSMGKHLHQDESQQT